MRKWTLLIAVVGALSFAGCGKKDEGAAKKDDKAAKKDEPKKDEPKKEGDGTGGGGGQGVPGPGGPGSGTGGAGSSGKKENNMANCPSAVQGATTSIAEAGGAVEVTVTGADDAAVAEIRKRSQKLAESSKAPAGDVKHTGGGTGGGDIGHCPVVLGGTTVEYAEVDKGAKLTVKPEKADDLAALTAESKRRNEAMPK